MGSSGPGPGAHESAEWQLLGVLGDPGRRVSLVLPARGSMFLFYTLLNISFIRATIQ